jgi:hypothetical protein
VFYFNTINNISQNREKRTVLSRLLIALIEGFAAGQRCVHHLAGVVWMPLTVNEDGYRARMCGA